MKFNIRSLAILATATMPLRDVSGEIQCDDQGNELSITFHSPGTKPYQKAKHAAEERNSTRVFGRMQGKSETKQSAEDKLKERAEFMAAVTVSFNNFDADNDKRGHEMFKSVYADIELGHILEDGEKFVNDRGNFCKPSEKTSEGTSAT